MNLVHNPQLQYFAFRQKECTKPQRKISRQESVHSRCKGTGPKTCRCNNVTLKKFIENFDVFGSNSSIKGLGRMSKAQVDCQEMLSNMVRAALRG